MSEPGGSQTFQSLADAELRQTAATLASSIARSQSQNVASATPAQVHPGACSQAPAPGGGLIRGSIHEQYQTLVHLGYSASHKRQDEPNEEEQGQRQLSCSYPPSHGQHARLRIHTNALRTTRRDTSRASHALSHARQQGVSPTTPASDGPTGFPNYLPVAFTHRRDAAHATYSVKYICGRRRRDTQLASRRGHKLRRPWFGGRIPRCRGSGL